MISREAARKAWLAGLRNPYEDNPFAQPPSPTKDEFESWVMESYDALHSELFEGRRLRPRYFMSNEMYAYVILKNWKSRIGFGEGKAEDLREVLDYEIYFWIWALMRYREKERDNQWMAAKLESAVTNLGDGELFERLLEIANKAWKKALGYHVESFGDEEFARWFKGFNESHTGEKDVRTKLLVIRMLSKSDEDFRAWFVDSGLARETYRLLEYEDTQGSW